MYYNCLYFFDENEIPDKNLEVFININMHIERKDSWWDPLSKKKNIVSVTRYENTPDWKKIGNCD